MDYLLKKVIRSLVQHGQLHVTCASGAEFACGDGAGPLVSVRFTTAKAQWAVLMDPELKLGEAYMDGSLVVDRGQIADFLDLLLSNIATKRPNAWMRLRTKVRSIIRSLLSHNSLFRAQLNAAHHYNIDSRIYRLFLDSDMQYSCAYFEKDSFSLEQAQDAKKRHIAAKLLLDQPKLRVLDIGCGWGGLGLHLAREHKADIIGINLSSEQISIARERAATEGLPCDFRVKDYREMSERFDRVVSVGMFEHVGKEYYDCFFEKCYDCLEDNGVMLLHTVGRWDGPSITNAWVWRYIFPGGYAPALSELSSAIERSGFIISDIEVLRLHYAHTLRHWRESFLSHRDQVLQLTDEKFIRMWEYYLSGFEASFRYYGLCVFQIQLVKDIGAIPLTRRYMYEGQSKELLKRPVRHLRIV